MKTAQETLDHIYAIRLGINISLSDTPNNPDLLLKLQTVDGILDDLIHFIEDIG